MLPMVLAAGALGAVLMQRPSEKTTDQDNEHDDTEKFMLGRSRDKNLMPGKTLIAENVRIIRPTMTGIQHPVDAADEWDEYHRKYENVAHELSNANYAGGDNARYFRNDINKRVRRAHLPDRESFSEWGVLPTTTFEYENHPGSSPYPDIDYSWYDDQTGETMAVEGAPHYIAKQEYLGNPWGPSGQLFNTEGMRTKSVKDLKRDKIPDRLKKNNRVSFYGLPQ
jgi:hypothetical protein